MFKIKSSMKWPSDRPRRKGFLVRAKFSGCAALQIGGLLWLALQGLSPAATQVAPMNEGQQAFDKGQVSRAAETWEKAVKLYHDQRNPEAEMQASVALAGAYQSIGLYRRSVEVLEGALARANPTNNQPQVILLKSRLGGALTMTRDFDRAEVLLRESLAAAKAGGHLELEAQTLNELGNLCVCEQKFAEGLAVYEANAAAALQTGNLFLAAQ